MDETPLLLGKILKSPSWSRSPKVLPSAPPRGITVPKCTDARTDTLAAPEDARLAFAMLRCFTDARRYAQENRYRGGPRGLPRNRAVFCGPFLRSNHSPCSCQ